MKKFKITISIVLIVLATVAVAQTQGPPLSDKRLSVNTLLREDIFSGFLTDDMDRFSKGEKNIDLLLAERPAEKSTLLAWKAGATLYRAVRAFESKQSDEFQKYYKQALDYFSQARQANPNDGGVDAITGGSFAIFADRLPKELQAASWQKAYDSYQALWKIQGQMVDRLPLHLKGELLSGLVQSAQRTGHTEEVNQLLDKILDVLKDTPYERVAKQWKANPSTAAKTSMTCLTCHEAGRLNSRLAALNTK